MRSRCYFIFSIILLTFVSATRFAFGENSLPQLRIGLIHTFSKADPACYDQFTNNLENAVVMAWDDYKASHRSPRYNIVLTKYDIMGNELKAADMMTKAYDDGSVATIGYVCSNYALLGGRRAQDLKVPLITPTATADEISNIGDYVYMSSFRDSYQGQVLASFAINDLGLKKAIIIKAADSIYSVSLANAFKREYVRQGGNVIFEKSILTSDTDYEDLITRTIGMDYQMVFIPNYALQTAGLIAAFLKHGQNKVFIGGDGWNLSDNTYKIIGDKYFEGYMTMSWVPDVNTKESRQFVKNYIRRYHEEPLDVAAHSYDSAMLLFESIENASGFTREGIKNSLARTSSFHGVTGKALYNKHNYPAKSVILIRVRGKNREIYKIFSPNKL